MSDEFKKARAKGLGGSDIGAIFDCPTAYKSAYELYMEKVYGTERDISTEQPVIWGNLLEEPIAQHYSQVTGKELINPGNSAILDYQPYPFLLAHPDRLIKGERKGLEIKTVNMNSKHLWGDGGPSTSSDIPMHYYYQIAHYMLVLDYPAWDVAVLFGGNEFRIYNFERDYEMDELIFNKAKHFWEEHVLKKIPPDRNFVHPRFKECIKRQYDKVQDEVVELPDDCIQISEVIHGAKEQIREYQKIKEGLENKILADMGNASVAKLSNGNYFVRKQVTTKEYTVKAKEYVQLSFKVSKE